MMMEIWLIQLFSLEPVRDEIEELMDDEGDMVKMCLIEKKKAYGVIILRCRSVFGRTQINEWDSIFDRNISATTNPSHSVYVSSKHHYLHFYYF
ncbi:hypothetical protein Hanom_Chr08g00702731 [Helianthus anomalus]